LILLGDTIYADFVSWSSEATLCKKYDEQFSVDSFRLLLDETDHLATWDDHDLGPNNAMGGENEGLKFRNGARKAFMRHLISKRVLSGDLTRPPNEIYCTYRVNSALFIVLDARFYRKAPVVGNGDELLGKRQEIWLWSELEKAANGTQKATVICCSSPTKSRKGVGEKISDYGPFFEKLRDLFSRCPTPIIIAGDIHKNVLRRHSTGILEINSSGFAQIEGGSEINNWGMLEFLEDQFLAKLFNGYAVSTRSFRYTSTQK
jgi:hypothetical protein